MRTHLDNLVRTGQLKPEPPAEQELAGLIRSGLARLRDAETSSLSLEGRFDLAYNAAQALSLAALRWHGYRPENRYVVFQALAHTLNLPAAQWRVLASAHQKRNYIEYEGTVDVDEALAEAMIRVTHDIAERVAKLGPVKIG